MSRDLRHYARQTNARLLVGFILLLLIVGDGAIYLIYGPAAAISGMLCILAGLAPLALIFLFLKVLEMIAKRANSDE